MHSASPAAGQLAAVPHVFVIYAMIPPYAIVADPATARNARP
jgi:hypothetical protein